MVTYSSYILAWGSHIVGAALVILPLSILAWLSLKQIRSGCEMQRALAIAMLLAGFVPFVWFAAFSNHSATHSFFTVRLVTVPFAAVVGMAVLRFRGQRAKEFALTEPYEF